MDKSKLDVFKEIRSRSASPEEFAYNVLERMTDKVSSVDDLRKQNVALLAALISYLHIECELINQEQVEGLLWRMVDSLR